MSFSIILLIIASVLLVVAFVFTIKPMWVAAVPAWAAMMLLYWACHAAHMEDCHVDDGYGDSGVAPPLSARWRARRTQHR